MITAIVQLDAGGLGPMNPDTRQELTATTKDDIKFQVEHIVRMAYGQALAVLHHTRTGVPSELVEAIANTNHVAHIEWQNDGTTEALLIDVAVRKIAHSSCEFMVHKCFNEGV